MTMPFIGTRYSLVFFTSRSWSRAPREEVLKPLERRGFRISCALCKSHRQCDGLQERNDYTCSTGTAVLGTYSCDLDINSYPGLREPQ